MAVLSGAEAVPGCRVALLVALALSFGARAWAQGTPKVPEAEIKAAYLLNFGRYTEWPPRAFDDSATPLVVCVLESGEVEAALRRVAAGQRVNGRPVRVLLVGDREGAAACHLTYLAGGARSGLSGEPSAWAGLPVLTVGEGVEFTERGGMLGFVMVEQTVRFAANEAAARRAGLRLSSRMLALAVRR